MSKDNTGKHNSGHRNTGDCNSGDANTGYNNTGDFNSGHYNSGDYNSGEYNSGSYNSGWFNTDDPTMRFFGKDSEYTYSEFGRSFKLVFPDFKTNYWIEKDDMTKKEKEECGDWEEAGGYLKTLGYKEAWKEYWGRATDEEKDFFLSLPNFDSEKFEKITGIKV